MTAAAAQAGSYVRRETVISLVINTVLSMLFYALVFGRQDPVEAWGLGQWVFDFVPQSFMIALMSVAVPGALTAGRLRAGAVMPLDRPTRLPRNLLARALLLAVASAIVGTAIVAALVRLTGLEVIPATAALVAKAGYGALLAMIVTPIGLRAALARPIR
jgi:hypothetical protein